MAVIYNHTLYPGTSEADPAPKTRRWRVEEHLSYLIFVKCCLCEFCRVPCVSCFHGEDVIVRRKLKVMPGMAKMARQSCKAGIPKKGQRWAEGQVRWVRKTFEVLAVCRGKKKGSWRSKVPKKKATSVEVEIIKFKLVYPKSTREQCKWQRQSESNQVQHKADLKATASIWKGRHRIQQSSLLPPHRNQTFIQKWCAFCAFAQYCIVNIVDYLCCIIL